MQLVEDLLREALRNGDEQGRAQVRGRHLPDDLMADLAKQTHLYALEHAADPTPGRVAELSGRLPRSHQEPPYADSQHELRRDDNCEEQKHTGGSMVYPVFPLSPAFEGS
jgi:hypothetical protein